MKHTLLKKLTALFVTAVFSFSSLTANVNAAVTSSAVSGTAYNNFDFLSVIPMSQGKITSFSGKQSDTVVINVQDLHSHADTQRNISKIIDSISSKYNVSGIYTEGGFGKINVGWIDAVKDPELKNKIIEQLLNDGDLTASEYYAMTSKNPLTVNGLEDRQIHLANIKRLAGIENNKPKYEAIIGKVSKEIEILNKLYTNDRNVRFNRILAKYNEGKIPDSKLYQMLEKYVSAINKNPSKYNHITAITLDDYPNVKFYLSMVKESLKADGKRASAELQSLVAEIKNALSYGEYKQLIENTGNFQNNEKVIEFVSGFLKANPGTASKYRNLNKLTAINEFAKLLNPVDLLSEQRMLAEKIKFALSYDNTETEISFITDFKKYFADYLTNSLTQDDWIHVKENLPLFLQLYAKYAAYNNLKELEPDFAELTEYYDVNTRRNEIFLSNIFDNPAGENLGEAAGKTENSAADILKNAKDIKIVITGGYHSQGLKELLSQKGITSLVITPNVTAGVSAARAKYEEIIKQQAKFPSEALAYVLTSNTAGINQTAKIFQAAVNAGLTRAEIEKLIEEANISDKVKITGGEIIIGDAAERISLTPQENAVPVENINDVVRVLKSLSDIFDGLDIKVLRQIGKLFFNIGLGQDGVIDKAENAELQNEEYIFGIPRYEFDRYPVFLQEIVFGRRVISYDEMLDIVNSSAEKAEDWEKNPIFGYKIPEFKNREEAAAFVKQLPEGLAPMIGAMDRQWFGSAESAESAAAKRNSGTESEEYRNERLIDEFLSQQGSAIALQTMEDGTLDVYIIGKKDFLVEDGGPYEIAEKSYVDEYNPKLSGALRELLGENTLNGNNIVALRKTAYEKLIPVSELFGFTITLINSNGLAQEIRSGSFILIKKTDAATGKVTKFHIVNADPSSLRPINYGITTAAPVNVVAAASRQKDIAGEDELLDSYPPHASISSRILAGLILRASKRFESIGQKLPVFTFQKQSPVFGYKIPQIKTIAEARNFFNGIPKGISSRVGSVDNALYMSFLSDDFSDYRTLAEFSAKDEQWLRDSVAGAKAFIKNNDNMYDADTQSAFKEQFGELTDIGILFQFFIDSGSVIILQTNAKDRPDFYILGRQTYLDSYGGDAANIDIGEVNAGNINTDGVSLQGRLQNAFNIKRVIDGQDKTNPAIVGLKKSETVTAVRAQDLRLNIQSETSAGTQTNLNGAFIVIDKNFNWYAVNAEDSELVPVQYKRPASPAAFTSDDANLTLPWWFFPVSIPRAVIFWTVSLLFAPVHLITGKTLDLRKLKAAITSIVEIPFTVLLPVKTFVLLHYGKDSRETVKRYLYGHDAAEKSEILLDNERLINSVEKRLAGAEKIKRETLKWLMLGIPIVFTMFFLADYTDRHIITTRPFGDLLRVPGGEAAKIVFNDMLGSLLNNAAVRNLFIFLTSAIAAAANAVTHWKHNLNPQNIKAKATLDISTPAETAEEQTIEGKTAEHVEKINGMVADWLAMNDEDMDKKIKDLEISPDRDILNISKDKIRFNISRFTMYERMLIVAALNRKYEDMHFSYSEGSENFAYYVEFGKPSAAVKLIRAELKKLADGKNTLVVTAEDLDNAYNINIGLSERQIKALYDIASEHHQGEIRKDGRTPYMAHILGVAAILIKMGISEPELIAAAFLHDAVEDSYKYYEDLPGKTPYEKRAKADKNFVKKNIIPQRKEQVKADIAQLLKAAGFDQVQTDKIMEYVEAMTKGEGKSSYDYFTALIAEGDSGIVLKLADRIYNMGDLRNNPEMAVRYLFGKNEKA
ncbi:MAG: HD domain-containing protein, partial [Endomicrobium sp.]|nr:HD domain-containing protein [Endomicrobium sp.]